MNEVSAFWGGTASKQVPATDMAAIFARNEFKEAQQNSHQHDPYVYQ